MTVILLEEILVNSIVIQRDDVTWWLVPAWFVSYFFCSVSKQLIIKYVFLAGIITRSERTLTYFYKPVSTLSPICNSDIVMFFPFSNITVATEGKQGFFAAKKYCFVTFLLYNLYFSLVDTLISCGNTKCLTWFTFSHNLGKEMFSITIKQETWSFSNMHTYILQIDHIHI